MPLKVGIVGAGRRVRDLYVPVLHALRDTFEVVGGVSRTRVSAERLAAMAGGRAYDSLPALRAERPDLLVVAVDAASNARVALEAIASGLPVLLETPIAADLPSGRRVVQAAARGGQPVGIAEQKPFLPWECFKRRLIDAGVIGRVTVVENDFRAVDYHAIAQLRRYLPADAAPLWVRAVRVRAALDPFVSNTGERVPAGPETWMLATITFTDGLLAVHHASTAYKKAPFRMAASLRAYGTRGSIVGSEVAALDASGCTARLHIGGPDGTASDGRAADRLVATWSGGADITWDSPLPGAGLDDDQLGLAQHLLAMRDSVTRGSRPLYGPHDALLDIEIGDATERSARRGGVPVFAGHACADPTCRPLPAIASMRARTEHVLRSVAAPFHRLVRGTGR